MIKLIDILKEMAISNAWSGDKAKLGEETDEVIEAAKKMGESNPVLWRGTKGVKVPGQAKSVVLRIMYITGDRTAFRGSHANAKKVIDSIGVSNPVFAHFDRSLTEFFGTPCVIVLQEPYKMYQSPDISDIMADTDNWETTVEKSTSGATSRSSKFKEKTDQELETAAKSYKEIDGKPLYDSREVIVDVKNYWAIPCGDEIKTYGDLVELLESYKKKFA